MADINFPVDGSTKGVVLKWLDCRTHAYFMLDASTAYGVASATEAGLKCLGSPNSAGDISFFDEHAAAVRRFAPRATPLARIALEHGHDAAREASKADGFDDRMRVRFPDNDWFLVQHEERVGTFVGLDDLVPGGALSHLPLMRSAREKELRRLGKRLSGSEASLDAYDVLRVDRCRMHGEASVTVL